MVTTMIVAVFVNPTKKGIFDYAKKVTAKLKSLGAEVLFKENYNTKLFNNSCFDKSINKLIENCDIVLTIGGDGTFIHFAKYAAVASKPILGINFGRLGFITEIEKNELDKLELLVARKYFVQKRSLLEVTVYKENNKKSFWAINDAVIFKGECTKIIDVSVFLQENKICSYRADGLIIANSTGSTAYSLSAGGPIVDPRVDCILLTPICAHSMFVRPIILSGKDLLTIKIQLKSSDKAFLNIDGINKLDLSIFDKINIAHALKKIDIITFDSQTFYKNLSQKLIDNCN